MTQLKPHNSLNSVRARYSESLPMSASLHNDRFTIIVSAAIFMVGATVFLANESYAWGASILFMVGLINLRQLPNLIKESKDFKKLITIFAMFGIYGAVHSGFTDYFSSDSFKYFRFVLVWPITIAILVYRPKVEYFFIGAAVGSVSALLIGLSDILVSGNSRASGLMHPIHFGNIALLMGFSSGIGLTFFRKNSMRTLLWFGLFSGILASLISGSRGGWLAIPFALMLCIFIYRLSIKKILLPFFVITCLMVALMSLVPSLSMSDRFIDARVGVDRVIKSNDFDSSVGQRIEMWRMLPRFLEMNPIVGIGDASFINHRDKWIESGDWRLNEKYDHLHSDYIDVLARRGALGLFLTLALLYIPWRVFSTYSKNNDLKVRAIAGVGMLVPLLFSIYGLTETMLMSKRGLVVYMTWIPIIYALLLVTYKRAMESTLYP